ncbi:transposase [Bifidobacterium breve]
MTSRAGSPPAWDPPPCMFDGLTAIGVDETSYRKGRTYITVVVDHKRKRVVWAHDRYGKEVLDLFFRQLTDEQRASIKAVTGDGAKWIDASVKEHRPNAERVLDSLHIVSCMTYTLDQVRKRLWNQARRDNLIAMIKLRCSSLPTQQHPPSNPRKQQKAHTSCSYARRISIGLLPGSSGEETNIFE